MSHFRSNLPVLKGLNLKRMHIQVLKVRVKGTQIKVFILNAARITKCKHELKIFQYSFPILVKICFLIGPKKTLTRAPLTISLTGNRYSFDFLFTIK